MVFFFVLYHAAVLLFPSQFRTCICPLEGGKLSSTNTHSACRFWLTLLSKQDLKRKQAKSSSDTRGVFACRGKGAGVLGMMHYGGRLLQIAYTALLTGNVLHALKEPIWWESITATLYLACSHTAAASQQNKRAIWDVTFCTLKTSPEWLRQTITVTFWEACPSFPKIQWMYGLMDKNGKRKINAVTPAEVVAKVHLLSNQCKVNLSVST